jgi:hypothetical protein
MMEAPTPLRLIKRTAEFKSREQIRTLPRGIRGIYVLYRQLIRASKQKFDVLYVGMTAAGRRGGIRGRLRSHAKKKADWTRFSVYEVWDNIRDDEVAELEGLFRHTAQRHVPWSPWHSVGDTNVTSVCW